jgi:hypothetical protein
VADFAPQRGGQPTRSVITVAELLGRRHVPAGVPDGRIPTVRTAVSVSALMRREGKAPHHPGRPLGSRAERMLTGLSSSPRRKMATAVGAMIAVGSLASAAALLGHNVPGPTSSGALDGGYPGQGGIGAQGQPPFRNGANSTTAGRPPGGTAGITPLAFTPPLNTPGGLSPRKLVGGSVPGTGTAPVMLPPVVAKLAPTTGGPPAGGVPSTGGAADGSSFGGTLGSTVNGLVGGLLVGSPSSTSHSSAATVSSPARSAASSRSPGSSGSFSGDGSALSSLTNPITHQDAVSNTVRSGDGPAGGLLDGDSSSGRHSVNRLSTHSSSVRQPSSRDSSSSGGRHNRHSDGASGDDSDSGSGGDLGGPLGGL